MQNFNQALFQLVKDRKVSEKEALAKATTAQALEMNFQGIFLSPQQAKALANVLNQNVSQYEAAFGEIRLEPKQPGSPIQ